MHAGGGRTGRLASGRLLTTGGKNCNGHTEEKAAELKGEIGIEEKGKCAGSVSGAYRGCDKMSVEPQEACSKAAHRRLWMLACQSKIKNFLHSGIERKISKINNFLHSGIIQIDNMIPRQVLGRDRLKMFRNRPSQYLPRIFKHILS